MKAAAIFTVCLIFSRYSEAVNVEEPAIQQKKDVQQTSGLMLMYKFMEDMFVIRKEMIAIRSELSVQDIENKKLKEDIRELKSQLDQQQSQNAKQESQIAEQKSQIVEHKKTTERLQNQISKEIKGELFQFKISFILFCFYFTYLSISLILKKKRLLFTMNDYHHHHHQQ